MELLKTVAKWTRQAKNSPLYPTSTRTTWWLLWNLLASTAPLWIGYIILYAQKRSPSIYDFAAEGEFLLYSSATVVPMMFIMASRYRDSKPFPFQLGFGFLGLVILIYSVSLYGTVFSDGDAVEAKRLAWMSVPVYVFAVILGTIVYFIDNKDAFTYQMKKVEENQVDSLEQNFRKHRAKESANG